ncbi:MAG: hypothetical protein ACPG4T_13470, partial [Nannocystaceae bacterium]
MGTLHGTLSSTLAKTTCGLALLGLVGACQPQARNQNANVAQASALGHTGASKTDHSKKLAMTPISWLVTFNRLQTAKDLEQALNKKPGQFSKVDVDGDGTFDPIQVVSRARAGGHAFELASGATVVATLLFDDEWQPVGSINGPMAAVAAASKPATPPTLAPAPRPRAPAVAAPPAPSGVAANPGSAVAAAGTLVAPPAGSEAATLLAKSRQAMSAGQTKDAYLQASKSFHAANSEDALEVMAKS